MDEMFSVEDVRRAFRVLENHMASQDADDAHLWAIHWAAEDVVAILTGQWVAAADPLPVEVGDDVF